MWWCDTCGYFPAVQRTLSRAVLGCHCRCPAINCGVLGRGTPAECGSCKWRVQEWGGRGGRQWRLLSLCMDGSFQLPMAGSFQLPISVQVSILVISDRLAELQHLAVVFSRLSSHLQVPDYGPLHPPSPLPPSSSLHPPSTPSHPTPPPIHATVAAVHEHSHSGHVRGLGGGPAHDGEQASRLCGRQYNCMDMQRLLCKLLQQVELAVFWLLLHALAEAPLRCDG